VSVVYPADRRAWWLDGVALACVECGEPIELPAVYWHGATRLLLHADCAQHLGIALLQDARECDLAASPHWRRRAVATVKHRLVTEEAVVA